MDPVSRTNLTRRLLQNLKDKRTDHARDEAQVSAAVFTSLEHWQRERQALFLDAPQPVAFSGELAEPSSYLALSVLDIPVLLTRDEHGTLRAFINACAHRGAPVATGQGTARSLVCPFHGWAYQSDGSLRGRPEDEYFSTEAIDCALTALPVSEHYGVIVVALQPSISQDTVDTALDDIGGQLAAFGFADYLPIERRQFDVAANWKLVNDLSLESYHFTPLHRDSVAQVLLANAVVDTFGRHSRWAFPLRSIANLADRPEAEWPEQFQGSLTFTLYPGVMLLVNLLGAQMIRAEPGKQPSESRVTYVGVRGPDCSARDAHTAYAFGGDVFAQEDLPMAEACQQGLTATGQDLLLGRNEPLLQFWHQLWQEAIQFPRS
ncbi:MAG: aromatic ring-hydroxylating dioxygenase subunit alpha [Halioglobus sp.]|nr:aromatic ring-hydroxylating dioxygenase subunit alpha [Halioglobus sp.]